MTTKAQVVSVRLTDGMLVALKARADAERQPVSRMAALIIEDALVRPRLAHSAPLHVPPPVTDQVLPNFRQPTKKKRRR